MQAGAGPDGPSGDSGPTMRAAGLVLRCEPRSIPNLGVVPGKFDNAPALSNADPGPITTDLRGKHAVAPACRPTIDRGYGSLRSQGRHWCAGRHLTPHRHCEERSDEAIQTTSTEGPRLLWRNGASRLPAPATCSLQRNVLHLHAPEA